MYHRSLLLAAAFLLLSVSVAAQDEGTDELPEFTPSWSVKWNPAGLAFGKVTIGGEFNFKNRKSITAVIGLPKDKELSYEFDGKDRSLTYKTTSIMGGYRMYLGKKSMTGFYFEPYLKYLNNQGFVPNIDVTIGGQPTTFNLSSDYTAFGLGAQLGVQFAIADRVVIDWYLIGPEGNRSKFQVTYQDVTNPPSPAWDQVDEDDAKRELIEFIDDIPILRNKVDISVNRSTKTVSSSYRGFVPGFRTGISIGLKF